MKVGINLKDMQNNTSESVYKGILAQILPVLLTGGHWVFYSIHTGEYASILELITQYNKTDVGIKRPLKYKQINGGLLVYTTFEEILQILPELQQEYNVKNVDINDVKQQYLAIREQEQTKFLHDISVGLQQVGPMPVNYTFGLCLEGFAGQQASVEGINYNLYKLDANDIFKLLYRYWWQQNKKPVLYLCNAMGVLRELTPAFQKYSSLLAAHKNKTITTTGAQQLNNIGVNTVLPTVTPLFTGNALMCTVVRK